MNSNKKNEKQDKLATQINRREMIGGLSSLAIAPSLLAANTQDAEINPSNATIDFSDPIQNAAAYVKLIGTTARGMIHMYGRGTIYGVTPEGAMPMVGHTSVL